MKFYIDYPLKEYEPIMQEMADQLITFLYLKAKYQTMWALRGLENEIETENG